MDQNGYGNASVPGGKTRKAHRVAYELLVGPIPDGLVLHHECRVPSCVRPGPEHTRPVTQGENVRLDPKPPRIHCPQGHLYAEHAYIWNGKKWCRLCRSEQCRRRRKAQRARR